MASNKTLGYLLVIDRLASRDNRASPLPEGSRGHQDGDLRRGILGGNPAAVGKRIGRAVRGVAGHGPAGLRGTARRRGDRLQAWRAPSRRRRATRAELRRTAVVLALGTGDGRGAVRARGEP